MIGHLFGCVAAIIFPAPGIQYISYEIEFFYFEHYYELSVAFLIVMIGRYNGSY